MSLKSLIGKVTLGSAGTLIKDISETVDTFIDTKGEKAERDLKLKELVDKHSEFIISQASELEKAYLVDIQDSRESNVKIQESDKASWLAKNVGYLLDITFTLSFMCMLILICFKQVPEENKELFYTGFGALGTYVSTILGFHRGTSRGSEEKQKHLMKVINK